MSLIYLYKLKNSHILRYGNVVYVKKKDKK